MCALPIFPAQWQTPLDPPALLTEALDGPRVRQVVMPSGDTGYLVSRYDDVARVLSDPVFSRARQFRPGVPRFARAQFGAPDAIINLDPPEHTRLRRVISRGFTPRRVEGMRPGIQRLVGELLDGMTADGPPADLVEALCAPLPIHVICELLGVPYRDRERFRAWTETAFSITTNTNEDAAAALSSLREYIAGLIALRRSSPSDDLLSVIAAASDSPGNPPDGDPGAPGAASRTRAEADGTGPAGTAGTADGPDTLTGSQLAGLGRSLLAAGHHTTLNQLAIGAYVLLRDPGTCAALRADPGVAPAVADELLRLHSTASFNLRVTAEPARIGGTVIPADQLVIAWTAAANRDPAAFPQPGLLDLHRRGPDHLSLGRGAHFCLGASLARLELGIALTTLVRRFATLRFAADPGALRWNPGPVVTGPRELPVSW